MPSEVLASRYAEALLGVVEDPATLEAVNEEVHAMAEVVAANPQFRAFLEGPNIRDQDKHALAEKVFGDKVHRLSMDYIRLLIDKHRIDHLVESAGQLQRLVEERRNQKRVQVTTAIPLPVDVADRLKRSLDVSTGFDCILEPRVDPMILGGVIAVVGDHVVDGSLRTALDDIKKKLMGASLDG